MFCTTVVVMAFCQTMICCIGPMDTVVKSAVVARTMVDVVVRVPVTSIPLIKIAADFAAALNETATCTGSAGFSTWLVVVHVQKFGLTAAPDATPNVKRPLAKLTYQLKLQTCPDIRDDVDGVSGIIQNETAKSLSAVKTGTRDKRPGSLVAM